jgi:hypothetical protein
MTDKNEIRGSNFSLYLQYDMLLARQLSQILNFSCNIYEEEFQNRLKKPSEFPLLLSRSDTSSSILIEVWSGIVNFAPEALQAIKILAPSALGIKIIHEFYKIRLTIAEILKNKEEVRKMRAERSKIEEETKRLKEEMKTTSLQPDEARIDRIKLKTEPLLKILNTQNIKFWSAHDDQTMIILHGIKKAEPPLEKAYYHIKGWLRHTTAGQEKWQNDAELIGAWLDWEGGVEDLAYEYQNYVSLCLWLLQREFNNQPWMLSRDAFDAICMRDRKKREDFNT